jgi:predicted lipid-binding transport protein (Tim44 family)
MPKNPRKLTHKDRSRLADPATHAILDAAEKAGEERFGAQMKAVFEKVVEAYARQDRVAVTTLKAEFDDLSMQHERFVEAEVERGTTAQR